MIVLGPPAGENDACHHMGSRHLLVKIIFPLSWSKGCQQWVSRPQVLGQGRQEKGNSKKFKEESLTYTHASSWVLHVFFPLTGILFADFFWLINSYPSFNAQLSSTSRKPFLTSSPEQVAHTGFPLLPECLSARAAIMNYDNVVANTTEIYCLTVLEARSLRLRCWQS